MEHSPIARNFYRLRRLLVEATGRRRSAIRPSSTLAELVPPTERRRIWSLLEDAGMRDPTLGLSPDSRSAVLLLVLLYATVIAVLTQNWFAGLVAILDGGYLAYHGTRRWATHISPSSMTLVEAAICMTSVAECRRAGYRLSQREIFVKVRLSLAQATGVSYEAIQPQSRLVDLLE